MRRKAATLVFFTILAGDFTIRSRFAPATVPRDVGER
jgi:hypothetical protein